MFLNVIIVKHLSSMKGGEYDCRFWEYFVNFNKVICDYLGLIRPLLYF
jgi:hypothetical protein